MVIALCSLPVHEAAKQAANAFRRQQLVCYPLGHERVELVHRD
ncbi:hypothetical protein [Methylocella tundrae]|nr:hypothetical protein [Methylocella tundrae]WPP04529.1 hypothetical protein SIN04_19215 [Methylocella tundrae]